MIQLVFALLQQDRLDLVEDFDYYATYVPSLENEQFGSHLGQGFCSSSCRAFIPRHSRSG